MADNKKIVIVGGGIAGLTAGIYAAKSGFKVEVYEKNSVPGGQCTGWNKKGFHIDNCIRWMRGTKEGTDLNRIWKDTGALGDEVEIIMPQKMYTSELNGKTVTLWRDLSKTERELIEISPEDEEEIKNLMLAVTIAGKYEISSNKPAELMGMVDRVKAVKNSKDMFRLFKSYNGLDTEDLIKKFKHPLIRQMISDVCNVKSFAYSFPMLYGSFVYGDENIPRGGSSKMIARMIKKLKDEGGKIYMDCTVEKIEVNDRGEAEGIRLKSGTRISADYIICACDPSVIFGKLLSDDHMDVVLSDIYKNRENYPVESLFEVVFEANSSKDLISGETFMEFFSESGEKWWDNRMSIRCYSYESGFSPKGKQMIKAVVRVSEDAFDYFEELYRDKDEYSKKVKEYALDLQRRIEERFPEYKDKLSVLDIVTPLNFGRKFNSYKGCVGSYVITKTSIENPYLSPYVKGISNVFIAGQWIDNSFGLLSTAITGKFALQRILKKEKKSINI